MRKEKKLLFAGLMIICMFVFTGCGKQKEITIQDRYVKTVFTVDEKATVKEALEEAELVVREKDEVTPGLETLVMEVNEPITIARYAEITLEDDGESQTIALTGAKVEDVLKEAKVVLDDNDLINYDNEVYLKNGMEIQIIRRQQVTLIENEDKREILTTAKTIKELLDMENIQIGEEDRISPELSEEIEEGMEIVLQRVKVEKITETESIPYKTENVSSSSMNKGTSKVTRAGVNGQKEVVYEVTYVDGVEESRVKVEEKVIKEPVNQIVTVGTKEKPKSPSETVVSKQTVYHCDGSGHGYHIITYADGSVDYVDF